MIARRIVFVGSLVLLHVVFAGECLVADRAMNALFASMFLAMPSCVTGCGEGGAAVVGLGVGAEVLVLLP